MGMLLTYFFSYIAKVLSAQMQEMRTLTKGCYVSKSEDGSLIQVCPKDLENPQNMNSNLFPQNPNLQKKLQEELNKTSDPKEVLSKIDMILQSKNSNNSLPNPKDMFNIMRDKLKVLESLEEDIKDAFHKIELVLSRNKLFMEEERRELLIMLKKMKTQLARLKSTKNPSIQSEITSKVYELSEKSR